MIQFTGLSSEEAAAIRKKHGPNSLPQKKKSILKKLLAWAISPVSLMLFAAAVLSYINDSKADSAIIIVLFLSNFIISAWHESKADKSIEKLRQNLAFKVSVMRDGEWSMLDSSLLVPGDIVKLRVGSVVPADGGIIDGVNLSANESVLTGESLPKSKPIGDTLYSGSFIVTGEAVIRVTATGGDTSFGKTAMLIDRTPRKSALQKDILSVSRFVSIISIIIIVILTVFLLANHSSLGSIATLDISLLIAGIPVALPTVMSLIISIGVLDLARKSAIVRRLASLEDLANVDLLLSDKTGTLTENRILVEKILPFSGYDEREIITLARSTFDGDEGNPFDNAVALKAKEFGVKPYPQLSMIPGDSERKRSTAVISVAEGKAVAEKSVSLGAAQIVGPLCRMSDAVKRSFDSLIAQAGSDGYRAQVLAVSKGREEKDMDLVGVILLADKVRSDARGTIDFLKDNGIAVKMVTGDSYGISRRMAASLGIEGEMCRRSALDADRARVERDFDSLAGFSEVLPKDKYDIVALARKHHVIAVTGDGVNDLPAIRSADVGFAVSDAVDALKDTADIVLMAEGISVVKDAIIDARKVFVRLYNYSIYRISESFRLVITIAVIGLIYKTYPLTPVELIILAFLNDVPIVSLAFDRVKASSAPSRVNARERFTISTLFGLVGTANSLILLAIMVNVLHLPWNVIQTVFFLKLTVSGHMLIYVVHTRERWYKFLPSRQVIIATFATQIIATALAFLGVFTTPISMGLIALVWVWSFFWMQISELMKIIQAKLFTVRGDETAGA